MAAAARIKRIVMQKVDALDERQRAALARLEAADLAMVREDGTISVFPGAAAEEDLEPPERQLVYLLMGYEQPEPDLPWVVKRAGIVGGRAAIAGTRTPVWRIVYWLRTGMSRRELRMQTGLGDEQIDQALRYAEIPRYAAEIERDVFDNVDRFEHDGVRSR
jgi:uncharacterized protein (DUF433 family)